MLITKIETRTRDGTKREVALIIKHKLTDGKTIKLAKKAVLFRILTESYVRRKNGLKNGQETKNENECSKQSNCSRVSL